MSYVVTGPVVVAKTNEGKQVYVYQGSPLPDEVPADEAERLVETGLVEKQDDKPAGKSSPRAAKD